MSEEKNWKDEEILDIGSVGEDDFDPFGDDDFELEIQQHEEKKAEEKKAAEKKAADKKPPQKKDTGKESPSNPLEAEISAAEEKDAETARDGLLNTDKNVFHCQRCKKSGNSITLYAERNGISNAAAYRELAEAVDFSRLPVPVYHRTEPETPMKPLEERSRIYTDFLQMLELSPMHRLGLQNRGLDDRIIAANLYRSAPKKHGRLYSKVMYELSGRYDLSGMPGFYRQNGQWHMVSFEGFFIPVRDVQGRIQGLQVRLDNGGKQKYKWFSSNGFPNGTKCEAFLHVVNWKSGIETYITEGALKSDTAHALMGKDACFIALPGVGSMKGLEQMIRRLGISSITEAFDMDQETNPAVRASVQRFYQMMEEIGVAAKPLRWNPMYKGIDDMLLAGKGSDRLAA